MARPPWVRMSTACGAIPDGIVYPDGWVEKGRYVAGRLHGAWVLRDAAGAVVARERWCAGRAVDPGKAGCE